MSGTYLSGRNRAGLILAVEFQILEFSAMERFLPDTNGVVSSDFTGFPKPVKSTLRADTDSLCFLSFRGVERGVVSSDFTGFPKPVKSTLRAETNSLCFFTDVSLYQQLYQDQYDQ